MVDGGSGKGELERESGSERGEGDLEREIHSAQWLSSIHSRLNSALCNPKAYALYRGGRGGDLTS